ncbi:sensor histidine kinase [Haloarchaeobius iranensis]|uniref:histidine kinase n=2 Tax=Haloarchaeobius iranensis TaxID=996166 RepID=A0A1G9TZR6_9EURY|nr:histidine kinase N-terminal 7TM domain-containing protein [Haloarchaeobius iranensis]SDM53290.1 Signal transduction histidine kinase [Haloarchaeobius iranensis]
MLFSAVVAGGLAVLVSRRDDGRGGRWFALSVGGIALWTGSQSLSVLATTRATSILWLKLTFLGSAAAGVALLLFAMVYTGRGHLVTPRLVALLSAEPLLTLTLMFTTERHDLLYRSIALDTETGRLLIVEYGSMYFVHLAYMSLLLAVTTALLVQLCFRARNLYRGQAVAILVAVGLPWAGTVVDGVVSPQLRVTEPSFAVSVISLWFGLFWYDLVEVPPVARARVLETLSEGVLVVNGRGRMVDLNPVAASLLDLDESAVGDPATDALAAHPPLRAVVTDPTARTADPIRIDAAAGERYLEVERTTLGEHAGEVFLLQDVTDRIRRERELERQNERLDQFASVVSHDLRNPLNVAEGYVDLLHDHVDGQEGTTYLEEVETSHDRMGRIVDDVLALARDGDAVEQPEPVPLSDLVADAWAQVETADATLACELDRTVQGDRGQLQRSFENLFRNAVEHAGRTVTVTVDELDDGRGFFVADDGPGIPDTEREAIIDSGHSGTDGTGLGLAIVENVVRAHGWTLAVTDSEPGGARFEIRDVEFVAVEATA